MTAQNAVTASPVARKPRLMVTVAALAAGAALALSGCSAGQVSQTANQAPAINGNNIDVEQISLRNVHIVYPSEGYTNTQGGKAVLALAIVNNSGTVTDELTSVTTDLGTVTITPPTGDRVLSVGPQQTVVAAATAGAAGEHGDDHGSAPTTSPTAEPTASPTTQAPATSAQPPIDPEANQALIEITGLTKDITPGLTYTVSFNFKQNGTVQVQVPVDAGVEADRHESDKSGPAPEGAGGGH
ncbi:hypothetical protein [Nocardia puris]|uniref:Copper(I)-binding protein n=1 Tax=Nocardia puris TaxID=208602 RepID=A0A366DBF7_9NOCA|nr:hypothetical protein [Nocardia puris]RBO87392.1 hypothetical protein DFR74_11198 [Nocardia puris]